MSEVRPNQLWFIEIASWGSHVLYGTETEAEEFRAGKAEWEGSVGRKRLMTPEEFSTWCKEENDLRYKWGLEKGRQQGAAEQREKLEICIAALNSIASWYDGPEVNGSFDSPGDAQTARNALEAIANEESKLTEGKIRTQGTDQREGLTGTEQSDGQTGEEGAKG